MTTKSKTTDCKYKEMMESIEYATKEDSDELRKFRREVACTQALEEDLELRDIIREDIWKIYNEVGGQDGMYDNFPISRILRGKEFDRIYVLSSCGGVAIINRKGSRKNTNSYQIVTLGEDDAWLFLNSRRLYEEYTGNKTGFVYLLSEALSLLNNNK